jgi:hypothetical protein
MAKLKKNPPKSASDEELWKKRPHNDTPTGEGNTLGEIHGQPPKSAQNVKDSNPEAKGFFEEAGEVAAGVVKGALKNLWDTALDAGEFLAKGTQQYSATRIEYAAVVTEATGDKASADFLHDTADATREMADNTNFDKYRATIEGPAEEFGDLLADLNPKGLIKHGIKKGFGALSKIAGKGETKVTVKTSKKIENTGKPKEKPPEKGGKVKGVKKTKVPCFSPYDSKRYKKLKTDKERQAFLKEYDAQLRRQQDAINNMSPEDFKIARDAYKKNKRNSKAAGAQESFRDSLENDISENISKDLIRKGMSPQKADAIAKEKAKDALQGLAALHEPDMVAGGYGQHAPKKMGDSGINSAIGGSWSGKRIKSLDGAAKDAIDSGLGDAKMNVQLELCRGKGKK